MITANLCKCNMCDSVLIDMNPQINAKEHPLTGSELEMVLTDDDDPKWVCPLCMTDDYLVDL